MNHTTSALAMLATGCFFHPMPPAAPQPPPSPAFTCSAPVVVAAPTAPTANSARSLVVSLVSGEAPDWSAAVPAPTAATPAWGGAGTMSPPAAAPVWGAAVAASAAAPAAPAAPAWGAEVAPAPAAPAAGAAWGASPAPVSSSSTPPSSQAWFDAQASGLIFSVRADGAPLGSTILAVGESVGLPVVVDPDLADLSLTVSNTAISLAELGAVILGLHGAAMSFDDGVLTISDLETFVDRNYDTEPAPLDTVILPTPDGVPADHLAATWCALGATDRGTASVVGDAVVFEDAPDALAQARRLAEELSITATAIWADESARSETP